jgi:hypothetical protein
LLNLDRLPGNELNITQELISNMLGVRRESVTEVAGKLQRAGLIDYGRGHITVLDRPGLEDRVCECYQVVKTEFDRLLPGGSHRQHRTFELSIPEVHETNISPLRVKTVKCKIGNSLSR